MAHKTLIGGTAYSINGGKCMVSGTTYNISSGRTLVSGTGYDISFAPRPYAMYYSDNSMVFQLGDDSDTSKTLTASYTGFENTFYAYSNEVPWYNKLSLLKSVSFNDEIVPNSIAVWFANARNLSSNISTFINLNMNNVSLC